MTPAAQTTAAVVAALNLVAAGVGGLFWWRVEPSRAFWVLCRCGQAAAVVLAVLAGVFALAGFDPDSGLFWLYAILPVVVSFVAESLRLSAAQAVLDQRGLEDAQAVGRLDAAGQRSVVLAIVRREMGTMALSCLVVAFLAARAWGTA
jgi:hypothetical protein